MWRKSSFQWEKRMLWSLFNDEFRKEYSKSFSYDKLPFSSNNLVALISLTFAKILRKKIVHVMWDQLYNLKFWKTGILVFRTGNKIAGRKNRIDDGFLHRLFVYDMVHSHSSFTWSLSIDFGDGFHDEDVFVSVILLLFFLEKLSVFSGIPY